MATEIEVKFLHVDHDDVRKKLQTLGAKLEHPMRMMPRVMLDHDDNRYDYGRTPERFRLRGEGDKATMTYKNSGTGKYLQELEASVESFEDTLAVLKAVGFHVYSVQESKRETWSYNGVEIVLDVWPWLDDYIEIEGQSEAEIKQVAKALGFDWKNGKFGSVETAYRDQFKGMASNDTLGDVPEIKFGMPLPQYFKDRL